MHVAQLDLLQLEPPRVRILLICSCSWSSPSYTILCSRETCAADYGFYLQETPVSYLVVGPFEFSNSATSVIELISVEAGIRKTEAKISISHLVLK